MCIRDSTSSVVEVARGVGEEFARSVAEPDPRDPRVKFRREMGGGDEPPRAPVRRVVAPRGGAPRPTARGRG